MEYGLMVVGDMSKDSKSEKARKIAVGKRPTV